jgi:hypothetical protein
VGEEGGAFQRGDGWVESWMGRGGSVQLLDIGRVPCSLSCFLFSPTITALGCVVLFALTCSAHRRLEGYTCPAASSTVTMRAEEEDASAADADTPRIPLLRGFTTTAALLLALFRRGRLRLLL